MNWWQWGLLVVLGVELAVAVVACLMAAAVLLSVH